VYDSARVIMKKYCTGTPYLIPVLLYMKAEMRNGCSNKTVQDNDDEDFALNQENNPPVS
jgi:hypothetical protein